MKIVFTEEKRGEIQRIQRQFKNQLSESQIKRSTAGAIKRALRDGITKGITPEIKENYNIPPKYLKNIARVNPMPNGNKLWGGIELGYKPIPIIAFKKNIKQTALGVEVQIQKGKTTLIRHAFIETVGAIDKEKKRYQRGKKRGEIKIGENTHVFARGKYKKKRFVPSEDRGSKGNSPLSRIQTSSPFTMGLSKKVSSKVMNILGTEVERGLEGQLRSAVDKITKK